MDSGHSNVPRCPLILTNHPSTIGVTGAMILGATWTPTYAQSWLTAGPSTHPQAHLFARLCDGPPTTQTGWSQWLHLWRQHYPQSHPRVQLPPHTHQLLHYLRTPWVTAELPTLLKPAEITPNTAFMHLLRNDPAYSPLVLTWSEWILWVRIVQTLQRHHWIDHLRLPDPPSPSSSPYPDHPGLPPDWHQRIPPNTVPVVPSPALLPWLSAFYQLDDHTPLSRWLTVLQGIDPPFPTAVLPHHLSLADWLRQWHLPDFITHRRDAVLALTAAHPMSPEPSSRPLGGVSSWLPR